MTTTPQSPKEAPHNDSSKDDSAILDERTTIAAQVVKEAVGGPPAWLSTETPDARGHYAYTVEALRRRYIELAGESFLVLGPGTDGEGPDFLRERVFSALRGAKDNLELDHPNLSVAYSQLDLVERYLVWGYQPEVLSSLVEDLWSRSDEIHELVPILQGLKPDLPLSKGWNSEKRDRVCARLDSAIAVKNRFERDRDTVHGLQIERLRWFRTGGLILLATALLIYPLFLPGEPSFGSWVAPESLLVSGWLAGLVVALVGTLGGFVSGLLQVRVTLVGLVEHKETTLKFQLKPIVGALAGLVIVSILTWGVVAGTDTLNPGTYILIAFASGFSERYFLRAMSISGDNGEAHS